MSGEGICKHGKDIFTKDSWCEECFKEGYSSKIEGLNEPIQTVKKICIECDEKYDIGNKCPNEPHTAIHKYRKLLKQLEECRKKEDELTDEMDSVWELLSDQEIELLNK